MTTTFESYDFAADTRWATIEANLYIPPGPDHDALLLRRKSRFYRDNIDAEYKVPEIQLPSHQQQQSSSAGNSSGSTTSSSDSASSSSSSSSSSSTSSASTANPPPFPGYKHHVPPAPSSSSTTAPSRNNNIRLGGLSLPVLLSYAQLVLHCIVVVLFPFVFLPILSTSFAHSAYSYSLYLSALAYILNLVRSHSYPTSPYQQYFLRLLQDPHSHYLFYAFVCLSAPPNAIFLVPFVVRSALYSAGALSRLLPSYAPALSDKVVPLLNRLVSQAAELQRTNAVLEITAGVYSIVLLFTSARSFFLVFLYFQYIRMRYLMSSDSQYAWAVVRATVERYVQAAWMPPVVKMVYGKVVVWMESMVDPQRMAGGGGGGAGGMMSRCVVM